MLLLTFNTYLYHMVLLKHLLLEINWNDYNISMRGEDFDPLKPGEFDEIRQQMKDPETSEATKQQIKNRVIGSYMRLLPKWHTETGARANGVPVDDFIMLAYDAMNRAVNTFDWEAVNQYGAYARQAIRSAVIDYGKKKSKEKQMFTQIDKPIGGGDDEGSRTLGDTIGDVANQETVLDWLDYEEYLRAVKEYFKTIKNNARKYALLKIVQPELRKVPFRELADLIEQQTGERYTPQSLQAQYTVLVNEILPKIAKKIGVI
jgi:DNA-directed RNA polymerase specialized sigma subunit